MAGGTRRPRVCVSSLLSGLEISPVCRYGFEPEILYFFSSLIACSWLHNWMRECRHTCQGYLQVNTSSYLLPNIVQCSVFCHKANTHTHNPQVWIGGASGSSTAWSLGLDLLALNFHLLCCQPPCSVCRKTPTTANTTEENRLWNPFCATLWVSTVRSITWSGLSAPSQLHQSWALTKVSL